MSDLPEDKANQAREPELRRTGPPLYLHGPHLHGPPWARHREGRAGRAPRGGPKLFVRMALFFGLWSLMMWGLFALAVRLIRTIGDGSTGGFPTGSLLLLLLLIPAVMFVSGRRAYRKFAKPLAGLIDATNAVAAGDRTVRLPTGERGDFARVEHSFNRMVEELELADQRRRTLTADVAHELRTPLQIIQGNLEGLLDGVYQPTQEHIEATLTETRQLARLIEDLRLLSQAEAGRLPMASEPVDLGELLQDIATSFGGQAQAAGVSLTVALPDPPIIVAGDSGRLNQVLSNIVTNALRHTPRGGRIEIVAHTDSATATLIVADSGEGIPAEELPFIFDRFWRGDRARTRATGGSGLGLAIARELVLAHGGSIDVESAPGAGSRFTIALPLRPPAADDKSLSSHGTIAP